MKNIKILALTALILLSTSNGVSATSQKQETSNFLDKANQYNIFAEEDISLVDSDVEGAVAGGKNVFVNQSFIASSKSSDDLISLISGKNIEVKNSDVFNGNVVYGGILGAWTSLRPPGFYMHASILEFGTTFDKIKEESVRVASLSLNTKPVIQSINKLQIYAEHSGFNITEVSGEVLSNVDLLELHIPQGSSLVVNVTGEQLELGTEMILDGDPSSLLFNFYQAHKITLENNVINGTILAPIADLQVDNSEIHGTLISKNLSGFLKT